MNESAVYNETDLAPFHKRLVDLRQIIYQDAESNKQPRSITKLLERQVNDAGLFQSLIFFSSLINSFSSFVGFTQSDAIVKQLQDSLSVLSPELLPVHQRLVSIRRQLATLVAKEGTHKAELKPLQEELRKIDSLSTFSTSP